MSITNEIPLDPMDLAKETLTAQQEELRLEQTEEELTQTFIEVSGEIDEKIKTSEQYLDQVANDPEYQEERKTFLGKLGGVHDGRSRT